MGLCGLETASLPPSGVGKRSPLDRSPGGVGAGPWGSGRRERGRGSGAVGVGPWEPWAWEPWAWAWGMVPLLLVPLYPSILVSGRKESVDRLPNF